VSQYGRKKKPAAKLSEQSLREASSQLAMSIERDRKSSMQQKREGREGSIASGSRGGSMNSANRDGDFQRAVQRMSAHGSQRSNNSASSADGNGMLSGESHPGGKSKEERREERRREAVQRRTASLPPLASLQQEVKPRFLRAMTGNEKKDKELFARPPPTQSQKKLHKMLSPKSLELTEQFYTQPGLPDMVSPTLGAKNNPSGVEPPEPLTDISGLLPSEDVMRVCSVDPKLGLRYALASVLAFVQAFVLAFCNRVCFVLRAASRAPS